MNTLRPIMLLLCVSFGSVTAFSQEEPPMKEAEFSEDATHDELRALRKALTQAVLKGDIEGQIAHADENIVTTWPNNRVVRGHDGLRKLVKEMNTGDKKVFQGYIVPPTADELTILHGGDTGIVFGKSVPHYKYLGMEFELENRWTATLIKKDGKWKIAAYHASANIMDNPVLAAAKNGVYWAGGISLLIGLVLGGFGGSMLKKKHKPDA
jgi:ketosteroid isomerase-like protein